MTDADLPALRAQLIAHEGLRLRVYTDTAGISTIGVGRNLRDKGISSSEALLLLNNDIADTLIALRTRYPWFDDLDVVRQRVIVDLAFNIGVGALAHWPKTLLAVATGHYADASVEMLASVWAEQVGKRARDLSEMMRTGRA